jgi:hypothetical protein
MDRGAHPRGVSQNGGKREMLAIHPETAQRICTSARALASKSLPTTVRQREPLTLGFFDLTRFREVIQKIRLEVAHERRHLAQSFTQGSEGNVAAHLS